MGSSIGGSVDEASSAIAKAQCDWKVKRISFTRSLPFDSTTIEVKILRRTGVAMFNEGSRNTSIGPKMITQSRRITSTLDEEEKLEVGLIQLG